MSISLFIVCNYLILYNIVHIRTIPHQFILELWATFVQIVEKANSNYENNRATIIFIKPIIEEIVCGIDSDSDKKYS